MSAGCDSVFYKSILFLRYIIWCTIKVWRSNILYIILWIISFSNSSFDHLCRWFTGWKKYAGFGAYPYDEVLPEPHLLISNAAERPGPIDNSNIVANGSNCDGEDLQLLDNLEEQRDYVVVSQDVWEKLIEW